MIAVDIEKQWSLEEAEEYCQSVCRHYENFTVGSLLFPKNMRQDLANIYAFCRISDDLGDEGDTLSEVGRLKASEQIERWEEELKSCFRVTPKHPVFVALRRTVEKYELPMEPFRDLISAFKQDQAKFQYDTYEELLDYCRRSANPVGRLYLMLFGKNEEKLSELSDYICTGLQLTNFWQDVERDLKIGRIYIPLEDMEHYGYSIKELHNRTFNRNFRNLLAFQVERTFELFKHGSELEDRVSKKLALEIRLFRKGGERILRKIQALDYNVFRKRPVLSRLEKWRLFIEALIANRNGIGR